MSLKHSILKKYWGYDSFRECQEEIIDSVLAGRDTIGLLPTGGGKSITFQVPAMMFDGLTVVITPLISLMKDQVDNLRTRGIRACLIHSGLTNAETRLAYDKCRLGKAKMLYVSPEKLQSSTFISQLRECQVKLIVIDEAHCISQWGYDFRPSYLKIATMRQIFPDAPMLALTASATPEVVTDIAAQLQMSNHAVFAKSFARPNISYIVRRTDDKDSMLLKVLRGVKGTAIVYVRSRRRTKELSDMLRLNGIVADYYHAGLETHDKSERQNKWKSGETRVIVATNAFGMGIDKPDVRAVVHYDLPSSLEEYYQESGRAGRDGKPSFAVILAGKNDKRTLTMRLKNAFPERDYIKRVYELLGNFLGVAVEDGYNNVYECNFEEFCERFNLDAAPARAALAILTRSGYIEYLDEIATRSRVMIIARKNEFYSLNLEPKTDCIFQALQRCYTGLFADYVYIDEPYLARNSGSNISSQDVYDALLTLRRMHVIDYVPRKSSPYVIYTTSRELPRYVKIPCTVYEDQRSRMEARINAMKNFTFGSEECRVATMLRYFGETPKSLCGKCDVCRQNSSAGSGLKAHASIDKTVEWCMEQQPLWHLETLIRATGQGRAQVIEALRTLSDLGKVKILPDGRISRLD